MRTLAVITGAPGRDDATRALRFVGHLGARGGVDVVLIEDPATSVAERRRRRGALEAGGAVGRTLAVVGGRLPRSGLLREVHLHGSTGAVRPRSASELVIDAFVGSTPAPYDLLWFADLVAMSRLRNDLRGVPAIVDVDRPIDLSSARRRRSARWWAAGADLVTVADADVRTRLAVPGALVLPTAVDRSPAFDVAVTTVLASTASYRPART